MDDGVEFRYVEILNDNLLGTLKDLEINKKDVYFQQDNDPKHTSCLAQNWFKQKKLDKLDWPASSPDTVAQKTVPMFGHFEKIDLP